MGRQPRLIPSDTLYEPDAAYRAFDRHHVAGTSRASDMVKTLAWAIHGGLATASPTGQAPCTGEPMEISAANVSAFTVVAIFGEAMSAAAASCSIERDELDAEYRRDDGRYFGDSSTSPS